MQPTKPVEANFVYHAPPGLEDQVGSLMVRRELEGPRSDWLVASAWELSEEERKMVAAGANVELAVWMIPPPPVSLVVRGPACDECGREAVWDDNLEAWTCTHVEPDRDPGMGMALDPPPPADRASDGDAAGADPAGG